MTIMSYSKELSEDEKLFDVLNDHFYDFIECVTFGGDMWILDCSCLKNYPVRILGSYEISQLFFRYLHYKLTIELEVEHFICSNYTINKIEEWMELNVKEQLDFMRL